MRTLQSFFPAPKCREQPSLANKLDRTLAQARAIWSCRGVLCLVAHDVNVKPSGVSAVDEIEHANLESSVADAWAVSQRLKLAPRLFAAVACPELRPQL